MFIVYINHNKEKIKGKSAVYLYPRRKYSFSNPQSGDVQSAKFGYGIRKLAFSNPQSVLIIFIACNTILNWIVTP